MKAVCTHGQQRHLHTVYKYRPKSSEMAADHSNESATHEGLRAALRSILTLENFTDPCPQQITQVKCYQTHSRHVDLCWRYAAGSEALMCNVKGTQGWRQP
eukprot:3624778-Amphidinium_carterae.1